MQLQKLSRWLTVALLLLGFSNALAQTATLKRNTNLRKSADSSSAVVEKLTTGAQVTLLSNARKSGYYHVQAASGAKGWVTGRNISVSAAANYSENRGSGSATADLLAKLQAARVTAVPKPLVIGGHTVCKAVGNSSDPKMIALNTQKNRVDIPSPDAYILLDWDELKGLPSASPKDFEGAPVIVKGYLSNKINVEDRSPGESTNCNLLDADEVDWHIYLTKAPKQLIKDAIIVETTPRTRPLHHWDKSVLDGLVNKNTQVRISGWLMYDFQHENVIGKERATVWEVHPITRIEVADGNGGWKNIEH